MNLLALSVSPAQIAVFVTMCELNEIMMKVYNRNEVTWNQLNPVIQDAFSLAHRLDEALKQTIR